MQAGVQELKSNGFVEPNFIVIKDTKEQSHETHQIDSDKNERPSKASATNSLSTSKFVRSKSAPDVDPVVPHALFMATALPWRSTNSTAINMRAQNNRVVHDQSDEDESSASDSHLSSHFRGNIYVYKGVSFIC